MEYFLLDYFIHGFINFGQGPAGCPALELETEMEKNWCQREKYKNKFVQFAESILILEAASRAEADWVVSKEEVGKPFAGI